MVHGVETIIINTNFAIEIDQLNLNKCPPFGKGSKLSLLKINIPSSLIRVI